MTTPNTGNILHRASTRFYGNDGAVMDKVKFGKPSPGSPGGRGNAFAALGA
jgi:hypothetical protein